MEKEKRECMTKSLYDCILFLKKISKMENNNNL